MDMPGRTIWHVADSVLSYFDEGMDALEQMPWLVLEELRWQVQEADNVQALKEDLADKIQDVANRLGQASMNFETAEQRAAQEAIRDLWSAFSIFQNKIGFK